MSLGETKIGLALGAGALRGLCHLGILQVLRKKTSHQRIAGTSIGALLEPYLPRRRI